MQCSVCNKTDKVRIGDTDYCSNCGAQMRLAASPPRLMDLRPPAPAAPPAPAPAAPVAAAVNKPQPKQPGKPSLLSRLFGKKPATPGIPPASINSQPNPAGAFHNRIKASSASPAPAPAASQPETYSSPISRFHKPAAAAAPATTAAVASATPPAVSEPALEKLLKPKSSHEGNHKPKHALNLAAGIASVAIMAGYIWVQNYPKLAARTAASKAGFAVNMPTYLPSSFSLSGPVAYGPGEVSFNFSGQGGNFTLTERKSGWDSATLLENYVKNRSGQYLAVQGQGLTIYLYDGNQASWVNHGIWYTLEGATRLNRQQVLKIVYSL